MKNERPLVSIVVPIYGVELYIKQCVKSLMEQTYNNIEYIFVNDCTQDNSILILKETIKKYNGSFFYVLKFYGIYTKIIIIEFSWKIICNALYGDITVIIG